MNVAEAAPLSAIAAIVTLVISSIALALFFGGAGTFWGPINDVFVAFTTLLLIAPTLAVLRLVSDQAGPWFTVLSVAAIGGALVIAIGQLSLVARLISLQTSFVVGGIGVIPLPLWMAALAYLGIIRDRIPAGIGYLAGGVLTVGALLTCRRWLCRPPSRPSSASDSSSRWGPGCGSSPKIFDRLPRSNTVPGARYGREPAARRAGRHCRDSVWSR